jgi:hypothetical protein
VDDRPAVEKQPSLDDDDGEDFDDGKALLAIFVSGGHAVFLCGG